MMIATELLNDFKTPNVGWAKLRVAHAVRIKSFRAAANHMFENHSPQRHGDTEKGGARGLGFSVPLCLCGEWFLIFVGCAGV
jgi:hypothetical protein